MTKSAPSPETVEFAQELDEHSGQASEFVKRLHNMLEQNMYPGVIEWTATGDAFVVKDMNEFIQTVTPRQFKHSNFASFVRQLNKYDFHKVKGTEAETTEDGKQTWVFRHPNFRAHGAARLELIKRKIPSQRRPTGPVNGEGGSPTNDNVVQHFEAKFDGVLSSQDELREEVDKLRAAYQTVANELSNVQRMLLQQQSVVRFLCERLTNGQMPEIDESTAAGSMSSASRGSTVPLSAAQAPPPPFGALMSVAANGQTRNSIGNSSSNSNTNAFRPTTNIFGLTLPADLPLATDRDARFLPVASPVGSARSRVSTPGAAQFSQVASWPGDRSSGDSVDNTSAQAESSAAAANRALQIPQTHSHQVLLKQAAPSGSSSSNYTPQWSTKPRVLLVDDDIVSRTLSSKFLSMLGCNFETAHDGLAALEMINGGGKYDLVLMDIVMPRLDGLSATTMIRQFDHRTPIISMTGNSSPGDIVQYFSHGMNDVLSKPFTQDGLVTILEKHLLHLRGVWDLRTVPRSPGLPPMSDSHLQEAVAFGSTRDSSLLVINPLASMGVSDDDYSIMIQNMFRDDPSAQPSTSVKRTWDDGTLGDGRGAKRSRFETVE